jgi:O-antigen/teichoic acid export membrane protein
VRSQPEERPPPLPLVPYGDRPADARRSPSQLTKPVPAGAPAGHGAVRLVQFGLMLALIVYLARTLGPGAFGIYPLALAFGTLALAIAWAFAPVAVERVTAAGVRLRSSDQVSAQLRILVVAAYGALLLYLFARELADAYRRAGLAWPLRWIAVSIVAQTVCALLTQATDSRPRAWLSLAQLAAQTAAAVALVVGGGGVAGATLGRLLGYLVAAALTLMVTSRIARARRRGVDRPIARSDDPTLPDAGNASFAQVTSRAVVTVDVILVAALVSGPALGRFGAALAVAIVLGFAGRAMTDLLLARSSRRADRSDPSAFARRLRLLVVVQGVTLAPLVVWAAPLSHLLFGHRYEAGAEIMRALAVCSFVAAPMPWLTLLVLEHIQRRRWLLATGFAVVIGALVTYVLARTEPRVLGASIGEDVVIVLYVGWLLAVAVRLVEMEEFALLRSVVRTLCGATAMAAVLLAAGTHDLSILGWVTGAIGGAAAFFAVLLATGEVTLAGIQPPVVGLSPRGDPD